MKKSTIRKINDNLGLKTLALEEEHGFGKLVKLFSRLREEESEPVDKYRQLIRRNEWGHPASSSTDDFLKELENGHLKFIEYGGALAALLNANADSRREALSKIYRSEKNRGRIGKSSPVGLDARRDRYEIKIEDILSSLTEAERDNAWRVLPLFPPDVTSAETEEERLFSEYARAGGEPLSEDFVEKYDPTQPKFVIAGTLLRDFLRYDIGKFNQHFSLLSDIKAKPIHEALKEDYVQHEQGQKVLDKTAAKLGGSKGEKFLNLAHGFSDLAVFDLSCEAKFGFKSSFGILHYYAWNEVIKNTDPMLFPSVFTELLQSRTA